MLRSLFRVQGARGPTEEREVPNSHNVVAEGARTGCSAAHIHDSALVHVGAGEVQDLGDVYLTQYEVPLCCGWK